MKKLLPVFLVFLLLACTKSKPTNEADLIKLAESIHENVITLDTHCDINVNNFTDSINYTQRLETQVNLPKMLEGGLDVAWFIVYTGQDSLNDNGYKKAYDNAISKFDAIHRLVDNYAPESIGLALNSDDVRRIHKEGKKVAMIGIENGYPIGKDLSNVKKFYDLGGRYMSLAHNGHSQLSDSNTGEQDDIWLHDGLSELGKQVIEEMNLHGMLIDLSHPSKKANLEMLRLSKAPVIASHSSARALCDHSRNLDDELLLAIKENGGVVQTVAFKSYLNTEKYEERRKYDTAIGKKIMDSLGVAWLERDSIRKLSAEDRAKYFGHLRTMAPIRKAKMKTMTDVPTGVSVGDFVDHIDYMVKLIGIDHVGISSDFDGGGGIAGWEDASETFNVTLELVKRGYTEKEIEQLWSGNLLRVLDEAQEIAKKLQAEKVEG